MTAKRWDGATFQDVTTRKRWDGGAWVDLTVAKRWDGATWQDIAYAGGGGGLSATADINPATGDEYQAEPAPPAVSVQSDDVTVTAAGGIGAGPTYSWAYLSGATGMTISNPTSNVVHWTDNVTKNNNKQAVWRCTVTRGLETVYVDITVSLEYTTDL